MIVEVTSRNRKPKLWQGSSTVGDGRRGSEKHRWWPWVCWVSSNSEQTSTDLKRRSYSEVRWQSAMVVESQRSTGDGRQCARFLKQWSTLNRFEVRKKSEVEKFVDHQTGDDWRDNWLRWGHQRSGKGSKIRFGSNTMILWLNQVLSLSKLNKSKEDTKDIILTLISERLNYP